MYEASLTVNGKNYSIKVDSFGEGSIPILICGHAEIYARILEQAFTKSDLLKKYKFFVPHTYWCENAPLAEKPEMLEQLTLTNLAMHLEEIRQNLMKQGLLATKEGKIGIYCHSFFSALAFQYAALFPESILFMEAEGPPPFNTDEWSKEKAIFFENNASKERKKALEQEKILPGESAVDQKSLLNFNTFRDDYHRMNPTLWFDFTKDYRQRVWGDKRLNMAMMQHYFLLLNGYDCRNIIEKVNCPVHFSLGVYDTPVPPYLWIDSPKDGGIGFFNSKKRDYFIHTYSGHWSFIEQSQEACSQFDNFIDNVVLAQEPLNDNKVKNEGRIYKPR